MFNKSFGQKILVVGFVYIHSREGLSWPLWVEFLEVKAIDRVAETCSVWLSQDVCLLEEEMFYDVGSFRRSFKLSWP